MEQMTDGYRRFAGWVAGYCTSHKASPLLTDVTLIDGTGLTQGQYSKGY